jgi:hypothetical protein
MPTEVNRAINAAAGQVGAASLKAAVNKYAGPKGVNRLREIRKEIREEMGGNIVKGPRADELKRRLQEEGLLPQKGKSVRQEFTPLPTDLKEQLAALNPPKAEPIAPKPKTNPRAQFANWRDEELRYEMQAAKADGNTKLARKYADEITARRAEQELTNAKQKDILARRGAMATDAQIEKDITQQTGDTNYDWAASRGKGSKALGSGAFGSVIKTADGDAVKRGNIGYNEADIIDRVGKADLGPKLIAADLDGMGIQPGTARGRVAMTVVPGSPIGNKAGDKPIGKTGKVVADAYWEARAKLHKMGIAHNDMHIENVFVDRKGTGRFVDMGLAQDSPKAALAEAMGVFQIVPTGTVRNKGRNGGRTGEGDWQAVRWEGSAGKEFRDAERSAAPAARQGFAKQYNVAGRVLQNKEKAILKLKSYGLNDQDVSDIMTHGIRSTPESFERGAMGKLTNQQAQNVINTLYEGI